jgi:hypothetical protein
MSRKDWNTYGVCPECGSTAKAPMGVIFNRVKHFWSPDIFVWEWKHEE